MGGSPLNCIKFLKIELKPVFGGFETQLKFIKPQVILLLDIKKQEILLKVLYSNG